MTATCTSRTATTSMNTHYRLMKNSPTTATVSMIAESTSTELTAATKQCRTASTPII